MRTFKHVLKIGFFIFLVVASYIAVIVLTLHYVNVLGAPVTASLIAASVAAVTGIVVLTKDLAWDAINRARLAIRFFPYDKRDCHATTFGGVVKTHYFRLRIENVGWRTVEDVEVALETVKQFDGKRLSVDSNFMPLRLFWSHWREKRYEISVPPGAYRHCDLGFIVEPSAPTGFPFTPVENDRLLFWFDVFLRPNTGRTSLLPGRYEITISAFGKHVKPAYRTIEFEWRGAWDNDIDNVLKSGLIIDKGAY